MYIKVINLLIIFFILNIVSYYQDGYYDKYYSDRYKYPHVYDIGHLYLPNLGEYEYLIECVMGTIFVLLCVFFSGHFIEFLTLFVVISIIRFIFINITVLPKIQSQCTVKKIGFMYSLCYDKIFSGHATALFLFTLFLHQSKTISMFTLIILNLLNALLIISTQAHYTIDVIVAYLVTFMVFENKKYFLKYIQ